MNGTENLPSSGLLQQLPATAAPNGTDAYGIQYVDVPIALASNTSGYVRLANLTVKYQYTATVDKNPKRKPGGSAQRPACRMYMTASPRTSP